MFRVLSETNAGSQTVHKQVIKSLTLYRVHTYRLLHGVIDPSPRRPYQPEPEG